MIFWWSPLCGRPKKVTTWCLQASLVCKVLVETLQRAAWLSGENCAASYWLDLLFWPWERELSLAHDSLKLKGGRYYSMKILFSYTLHPCQLIHYPPISQAFSALFLKFSRISKGVRESKNAEANEKGINYVSTLIVKLTDRNAGLKISFSLLLFNIII